MTIAYQFTEEERRITMLALAGFDITPTERATIRGLYMRMFAAASPAMIREAAMPTSGVTRQSIASAIANRDLDLEHDDLRRRLGESERSHEKLAREYGELVAECERQRQIINATTEAHAALGGIAIMQVMEERRRQDRQWGGKSHDDGHDSKDWLRFIADHSDRARRAVNQKKPDLDEHRKQLVEIAALAVAAIEAHDRKHKP